MTENDKNTQVAALSLRELKAVTLDAFVKRELASRRASEASKMERLRALRLAKDAVEHFDIARKTNRAAE